MFIVKSWSLGINEVVDMDTDGNYIYGDPIVTTKKFKKFGLRCKMYIFLMKLLEDYIEIESI